VDTSGEGSRQAEEGGLSGLVGPGVSAGTRRPEGLQLQRSPKQKPRCGRGDRISRRSRGEESVRYGDLKIASLLIADDVVLLAMSDRNLQHALERFAAAVKWSGRWTDGLVRHLQ